MGGGNDRPQGQGGYQGEGQQGGYHSTSCERIYSAHILVHCLLITAQRMVHPEAVERIQ